MFLGALNKCRTFAGSLGFGLGPGFAMKCLLAKVNEACLHCNYDRLCEILCQDSKDAQDILSSSVTMDQLRLAVSAEVENRLLSAMRNVCMTELKLKSAGFVNITDPESQTPTLHEASQLAGCIARASEAAGFLASSIADSASVAFSFLDMKDMATLRSNVQKIQQVAAEQLEKLDGMTRFFTQHDVGKALVALATDRVEHGQAEADYQELLKALQAPLEGLQKAAREIAHRTAAKSQGIASIVSDLSPAVKALEELQACAFLKRKAAQRADSETGMSAAETVQSCAGRLSKIAVTMVQDELSMNISEHLRLGCFPVAAFNHCIFTNYISYEYMIYVCIYVGLDIDIDIDSNHTSSKRSGGLASKSLGV